MEQKYQTSTLPGNMVVEELVLRRTDQDYKAVLCLASLRPGHSHEVIPYLHPEERTYFETLEFERRMNSYLLGRYTAKQAIAAYANIENVDQILIQKGIFDQPIIASGVRDNIQVSIAHCENVGAAIAFPEAHPMGIDIEKTGVHQLTVLETQMTTEELKLMQTISFPYADMLTLFWTAKEALSKALRTGLMTPFQVYEVDRIDIQEDHMVSYFRNFAQYKAISFLIGQYWISIAYPVKTDLEINSTALKDKVRLR